MIGFQIEVKLAGDKSESSKTEAFKSLPMMLLISLKSNACIKKKEFSSLRVVFELKVKPVEDGLKVPTSV